MNKTFYIKPKCPELTRFMEDKRPEFIRDIMDNTGRIVEVEEINDTIVIRAPFIRGWSGSGSWTLLKKHQNKFLQEIPTNHFEDRLFTL